ncbi:MAG: indole acetimide hydrolase, partial [Actinobacteria bacterium]|nr:indole acetimide hydrolase [Actinomycetota bacterium]MBT7662687.1 indole acetimide hydrolase [Actinomycetota bacterium]
MTDELWTRAANELATMIAGGETSSREVVDAHLARIDEVNGDLNAVVRVLADGARAGADAADAAVAAGDPLGPFHGVPITIKENLDCT